MLVVVVVVREVVKLVMLVLVLAEHGAVRRSQVAHEPTVPSAG